MMRLGAQDFGGPERASELAPFCEKLDRYGLSAIGAPLRLAEMSEDECREFGEQAAALDLVIGEGFMEGNLLTPDPELRDKHIEKARLALRNADAMGCRCVSTLVGTQDPSEMPLAPWPGMDSEEARASFREVVLRILDGLELRTARLVTEPWPNTFFYQPEAIREFVESVDDPRYGVHLDLMNMISRDTIYATTEFVHRVFDCLGEYLGPSVHLKDIQWDANYMFMKFDETVIGDGEIDYDAFLTAIATRLPAETACYCEHFMKEEDFVESFRHLHAVAERLGLEFHRRKAKD